MLDITKNLCYYRIKVQNFCIIKQEILVQIYPKRRGVGEEEDSVMGFIIDKIKIFTLICDKCKYKTRVQLAGVRSIRKYGWQLSKDKRCYCPTCRTDKKQGAKL